MKKLMEAAFKAYVKVKMILDDERGSTQYLAYEIGAAVVVVLGIVGAMVYAPQTASDMFSAAWGWIRGKLGF